MKVKSAFTILILLIIIGCFFSFTKVPTGKAINIDSKLESKELTKLKDLYNENVKYVPSIIKTLFGNEDINVYIYMSDGSERLVGIVMRKGLIKDLNTGLAEPTMNAYTSEETINKIADGELNIVDALNNGDIQYKSLTIKTSLKTGVAKLGSKLFGWLT